MTLLTPDSCHRTRSSSSTWPACRCRCSVLSIGVTSCPRFLVRCSAECPVMHCDMHVDCIRLTVRNTCGLLHNTGLLQLFGTTLALQLNYDPEVSFAGRAYTWLTTPVLRTFFRRCAAAQWCRIGKLKPSVTQPSSQSCASLTCST